MYVPQLSYPFVCRWTSRLLPCPSSWKQGCNEHWGTRVSFNSGFLHGYAQQWDCWVIWQFYFQFFKESPHCSPFNKTGDFPGGSDGKSICLQCGRPRFDPWVRKTPWRRKWQPTPILLPGKSLGRRSLVDCSPWGRKVSDTIERLHSLHFLKEFLCFPILLFLRDITVH